MVLARTVLLVTPTAKLSSALVPAIRNAGYRVMLAKTFEMAKALLADSPDLVITELKLGEYNGLQLALRSRPAGIPTVVIADKSFEHDVEQFGAIWLPSEEIDGEEFAAVMPRLLPTSLTTDAFELAPGTVSERGVDHTATLPTLH